MIFYNFFGLWKFCFARFLDLEIFTKSWVRRKKLTKSVSFLIINFTHKNEHNSKTIWARGLKFGTLHTDGFCNGLNKFGWYSCSSFLFDSQPMRALQGDIHRLIWLVFSSPWHQPWTWRWRRILRQWYSAKTSASAESFGPPSASGTNTAKIVSLTRRSANRASPDSPSASPWPEPLQ